MRHSLPAASLAIVLSLSCTHVVVAQVASPRYVVTDLGDLGGLESVALDINASGSIVGNSSLAGPCGETGGFLYENGVMTELPSLPGTRRAILARISDAGDVVGSNDVYEDSDATGCPSGTKVQTPVLISQGVAREIPGSSGWSGGRANAVNNLGQVVGWSEKSGSLRAWFWEDDVRTDLGIPAAVWSIASGINAQGLVVGYAQLATGLEAFRWSGDGLEILEAPESNAYNGASDVNERGDAAGWSGPTAAGVQAASYPTSGPPRLLGSLGGAWASAAALNDRGVVVGYADTKDNQSRHAFVYRDEEMSDLNALIPPDSGWELMTAAGVNDVGEIVGWGCRNAAVRWPRSCDDAAGSPTFRRAFLLTPVVGLADLEALVRSFGLPPGLETSLLVKLAAARKAADAGRINTACNALGAFARHVEAQAGKALTTADAELLLQTLRLVRTNLGCA